ncbi:MAG TPA: PKD domain containing protein, partial [Actinopolymorphaceae bacterium]
MSGVVAVGTATAAPTPGAVHDKVVSADPVNWTPHVLDGRVKAIVQAGDMVILGGSFTQVASADQSETYDRANIVAVDAKSGEISTSFAPQIDGEVTALQVSADGKSVYAGGFFDTVNGAAHKSLARIDLDDGSVTAGFKAPAMSGRVKDLRLDGDR